MADIQCGGVSVENFVRVCFRERRAKGGGGDVWTGGSAMVFDECGTVVSVFFERYLLYALNNNHCREAFVCSSGNHSSDSRQ